MKRKKNIGSKNKKLWSKGEKRGLLVSGLVFLLIILIFLSVPIYREHESQKVLENLMNQEIPFQEVCVVSNEIKFEELEPVIIENKTYWVCCPKCKAKLIRNSNTIRFAFDPYLKEKLNKADAIIIQNPENKGKVLYFKSKENLEKFNIEM